MASRELNKKYKDTLNGMIYKSKNYGKVKIVEYKNSRNVIVEFLNTGNQYSFEMRAIRAGWIRDMLSPREKYNKIWGGGNVGYGKYIPSQHKDAYNVWSDMLKRCYSKKDSMKHRSYFNICSVTEEWFDFQNFAEWYYTQPKKPGWEIDKDIICKGNKLYSPKNCAFVPSEINLLFIKNSLKKDKNIPIGVRYKKSNSKNPFSARCKNEEGKSKHLGCFPRAEDAFDAYKQYKEQRIRKLAEKYRKQLSPVMYEAMLNYQIEITD